MKSKYTQTMNDTNMTSLMQVGPCPKLENSAAVFMLYVIICVVGIAGNTLVIFVVLRSSKLHNVTNTYILNLAIADFCFVVSIPFLVFIMSTGSWPFDNITCKVFMGFTGLHQFTSSILLCVMSADRYVAVCYPYAESRIRTPFVSRIVSAFAWIISFIFVLPIFYYATVVNSNGQYACNIGWLEGNIYMNNTNYTLFTFTLVFVLPLMLICVFYSMIICKLKTIGPKNKVKENRSHRNVANLVKTLIAVYAICWLPHWAFQIVLIYTNSESINCSNGSSQRTMALIFALFSYANSAINPILYAFISTDFMRSFWASCARPTATI